MECDNVRLQRHKKREGNLRKTRAYRELSHSIANRKGETLQRENLCLLFSRSQMSIPAVSRQEEQSKNEAIPGCFGPG